MKWLIAVTSLAAFALAADAAKKMSEEDYIRSEGGLVLEPNTQKGEIAYVNCQSAAKDAWIEESAAYFRKEAKFKITVSKGSFEQKNPKIVGDMTLFIVDDPAMPSLLVAPENRWAMVNVAPLKSDKEPFFRARVLKELTRGFAMLCGASDSQFPGALTSAVTKVEDLDHHTDYRLPVDLFTRFRKYMRTFGVMPGNIETYETACCQGWAPPPTNDLQKAIWDKVHAIPAKPMKIEFDPKKGR
ncbi:MAG: hypothetical protein IKF72_04400 [Kiritimatiellae bacterium]|nr:hypothetical protein [Kiritimatiellia bacterium]